MSWDDAYRVDPEPFWGIGRGLGDMGYDAMARAEHNPARDEPMKLIPEFKWKAVASWGRDGWDMLEWPYYVFYMRTLPGPPVAFQAATDCEGDVTMWSFPTPALCERLGDEHAFFAWKNRGESWVEGIDSAEAMPEKLRGPFSWKRLDAEKAQP